MLKALNFRGEKENEAASLAAGENLAQKPAGSFEAAAAIWPAAEEYKEWFANTDGQGYGYLRVLYNAKKGGVPEGAEAKAFEDCLDLSFLLNALGN